jgi:hypothetical protein
VKRACLLSVVFVFALAHTARGNEIFDISLGVGSGSVTGTITTDGTLGQIGKSDILGLDLTITAPFSTGEATDANGDFYAFVGVDLSETASDLTFNFNGSDMGGFTILTDSSNAALSIGTTGYLQSICGVGCDPQNTPGVEADSREYPVYYTQLTGNVSLLTGVPEPGTLVLFATGLIGFGAVRIRREQTRAVGAFAFRLLSGPGALMFPLRLHSTQCATHPNRF